MSDFSPEGMKDRFLLLKNRYEEIGFQHLFSQIVQYGKFLNKSDLFFSYYQQCPAVVQKYDKLPIS